MRPVTVTVIVILLLLIGFFFIKPMFVSVEETELIPSSSEEVKEEKKTEQMKNELVVEEPVQEEGKNLSCSDECLTDTCQDLKYYKCVVQENDCKNKTYNGLVKGKCGVECFFNSDCKQDQECLAYKCIVKKSGLDLGNFPDPFLEETLIVIGAEASSTDVISAVEVSTMLQKKTGVEIPKELDQDIFGQETKYNFILIGSPCDNKFVEKIFGMTCEGWTLGEGKALIKITANGDKTAMLIAGKTPQDTLRAAKMVAAYESNNLEGTEMTV